MEIRDDPLCKAYSLEELKDIFGGTVPPIPPQKNKQRRKRI